MGPSALMQGNRAKEFVKLNIVEQYQKAYLFFIRLSQVFISWNFCHTYNIVNVHRPSALVKAYFLFIEVLRGEDDFL